MRLSKINRHVLLSKHDLELVAAETEERLSIVSLDPLACWNIAAWFGQSASILIMSLFKLGEELDLFEVVAAIIEFEG